MKRMRNVAPSIFQQIEKNYGNINELVDANMSIFNLLKHERERFAYSASRFHLDRC